MTRRGLLLQALLGSAGLLLPRAARAQQDTTLEVGMVGAISMTHWPVLVGLNNGYYAKQHIKLDLINIASSQGVMQQLAAGSLQLTISAGLTDPIYAIDKGAPIRIIRVEVQSPPYEINAKQAYTTLEDLKGKTVMIDSPKGITRIYLERMLAAHHIDPKDLDYVYAGATGARYNSLRAGANRRHHSAAAVLLRGRGRGLQQSGPDCRLRRRPAIHRRRGEYRLGIEESGRAQGLPDCAQ